MPSMLRAWAYLVVLSWQRQARARQMVWIALGLLVFTVAFTFIRTASGRWGMEHWRSPDSNLTFGQLRDTLEISSLALPWRSGSNLTQLALAEAARSIFVRAPFYRFSNFIFSVFLSFLLPIWSMSFATEALGGDREGGSLVWLLTRPLPRPAIFLAKYVALLPWSLGLNCGGFALLCLAGGKPGRLALELYWPSVFWGTLAFSALYLWMGTAFRRPAVVATVYSFFLETILGNMPGYLKRASISFYTRCMMFEAGKNYDVQPEKPSIYLAVDGATALTVLVIVTALLILLGMAWFSRKEYVTIE